MGLGGSEITGYAREAEREYGAHARRSASFQAVTYMLRLVLLHTYSLKATAGNRLEAMCSLHTREAVP